MTFEQKIRDRISKVPFKSKEKEILKVVLGEVQQKSNMGSFSEESGISMVKSMIKNNIEKVLIYMSADDPRRAPLEEENRVLTSLLPAYLTKDEVRAKLNEVNLGVAFKDMKNEGMAVGAAMKFFKSLNLAVEGDVVKQVVQELRA
jgi:uncharacterized protein YqeY